MNLFFTNLILEIVIQEYNVIYFMKIFLVPLGSNCSTTKILIDVLKLRLERNPFEWNTCNNLKKVIDLLKNKFDNFLRKDQIPIMSSNEEFAFKNDYDMLFNHEAQKNSENNKWEINEKIRDEIFEKYNRRILRTLQKINEAEKIIFFRFVPEYYFVPEGNIHNFPKKTNKENQDTLNELKNIYRKKNIECIYVNNIEQMQNFINYINSLKENNTFI